VTTENQKKDQPAEARILLAFVLSMVVLLLWGHFYKPPAPPPSPAPPAHTTAVPSAPAEVSRPAVSTAVAPAIGTTATVQATQVQTTVVESSLYRVAISNQGGVLKSWQLKRYSDDQKPPHSLDLVSATGAEQVKAWPLSLVLEDPQLEARANSGWYQMMPADDMVQAPAEVRLEWSDGHLAVTKVLKFAAGYVTDINVSATLDGRPLRVAVAWRGGFGDPYAYQAAEIVNDFYRVNGKLSLLSYKKVGVSGHPEQRMLQPSPLEYAGIEDQFFAAAFLSSGSDLAMWHWSEQRDVTANGTTTSQPVVEMAAGGPPDGPLSARLYVGPKDVNLLSAQQKSLEDLVQFGWMSAVAKPLLEVLKWLHRGIPNYGWAIVALTLIINMALFPLKLKSWHSTQRMQRVAPEANAIKQRYAKYGMRDARKQKMNEEMMELYKREGINPVGGCLPMLLQMPIWFALYRMLQGAVELRHAPWIGWIHDLSARDPYFIIPVLMTITMYLTTKMTPQPGVDPAQQKMMAFMPLMMGVLFFRLSSGLNLYILTSNVVNMGQQYFLNRTDPLPPKGKTPKRQKK
jgi:YidC/Oxa1 family membrane protein insertase